VAVATYAGINIALALTLIRTVPVGPDWEQFSALRDGLTSGGLYELSTQTPYIYSPLAAPLLAAATMLGFGPWALLHVAVLALLRRPLLIGLVACSWAFWTDVATGNTLTFSFVAGVLALHGSRSGAIAYLALVMLIPRPVLFPLAAWLLWRRRDLRLPALWLCVANVALVFASGYAGAWVGAVASYADAPQYDIGPTMWLGTAWLVVGVPVGVWLTIRGQTGWAGLAVAPYTIPQYFLFPLWELGRTASEADQTSAGSRAESRISSSADATRST
jgi:hypothetical protein